MAYGLDTDSFLNPFYHIANRRGLPEEMISDSGTNFVGTQRELRELVEQLDRDKIGKSAANKGIKWSFNPLWAPHFGGMSETMITSAKTVTYAILGTADVTNGELMAAFTGVEAVINSRPLTYQSTNPSDNTPINRNHFLIGQVGSQFAPRSVDSGQFSSKKRWRQVQELVRHFWHRLLRKWLPTLNCRSKWQKEQKDVQVNDVVLVVAPGTPRGQWPLGRVLTVFPGKDKHVTAFKNQSWPQGILKPITRICPLKLL